jgi:hypothetical protein
MVRMVTAYPNIDFVLKKKLDRKESWLEYTNDTAVKMG